MNMELFKFTVEAEIEVEAFEWSDAMELVEEYFKGQIGDLRVIRSTIKHK